MPQRTLKPQPPPVAPSLLSRPPMSGYTNIPRVPLQRMHVPGNIDLSQRVGAPGTPFTTNPQPLASSSPVMSDPMLPKGSSSTVYSSSFEEAPGRNVLIPFVIPDPYRGGYKLARDIHEARAHYERTGEHLGIFATPEDADQYAQALHEDLAAQGKDPYLSPEEIMNKIKRLRVVSGRK